MCVTFGRGGVRRTKDGIVLNLGISKTYAIHKRNLMVSAFKNTLIPIEARQSASSTVHAIFSFALIINPFRLSGIRIIGLLLESLPVPSYKFLW